MSKTIDERVVSMKFDNSQFERGAKETMTTLQKLEQSLNLKNASKGIQEVGAAMKSFSAEPIEGLLNALNQATGSFSVLERIATGALYKIGAQAVELGEKLVKSLSVEQIAAGWDKYADKTSSVQTIMAATAKDFSDTGEQMEFVNDQLEKLNWFTDETSYNFLDMVNNIGKFTSNSIDLETSVEAMQGIANWAAISGANAGEASRAMYNLSQAISVGSVKLMDWKSIENANMATAEFKEMAIQTAEAMGTLKKASDGTWKTLDDNEVSVRNFNAALSDGWFSSEVLMKTLSKYGEFSSVLNDAMGDLGDAYDTTSELLKDIDAYEKKVLDDGTEVIEGIDIEDIAKSTGKSAEEIITWFDRLSDSEYELGRRSFKAAQEAKTFQEAIDATKDAVSTGWMNTFEIIFGNYEQAKELWTDLANELWEVFASGGEARNEMLKDWAELGGRDELFEGIATAWENIKDIMEAVSEALHDIFPAGDVLRKDKEITGMFHTISSGADTLLNITRAFKNFTESISKAIHSGEEGNTAYDKLVRTFRGVFAVFDMGKTIVKSFADIFIKAFKSIRKSNTSILDVTASLGDWLVTVNEAIKGSEFLAEAVERMAKVLGIAFQFVIDLINNVTLSYAEAGGGLSGIVEVIIDTLNNLVRAFSGIFTALTGYDISDFVESKIVEPLQKARNKITSFIDTLAEGFSNFNFKMPDFSVVTETGEKFKTAIDPLQRAFEIIKAVGNGIVNVFTSLWNSLGPIAQSLGNVFKNLFDMIAGYFKNATFDEFLDLVNSGILTVFGTSESAMTYAFLCASVK